MKKAAVACLIFLLGSCQFFDSKVPDEDTLYQKRLKEIDWKNVNVYPSLPECDSVADRKQKKECFFESMAQLVQERLDADTIAMLYPERDTITVKVTVFSDAHLKFEPLFDNDSVSYDKNRIDSLITRRLADFPRVEPAQKEGVPVTTWFSIPVILNVEGNN